MDFEPLDLLGQIELIQELAELECTQRCGDLGKDLMSPAHLLLVTIEMGLWLGHLV